MGLLIAEFIVGGMACQNSLSGVHQQTRASVCCLSDPSVFDAAESCSQIDANWLAGELPSERNGNSALEDILAFSLVFWSY